MDTNLAGPFKKFISTFLLPLVGVLCLSAKAYSQESCRRIFLNETASRELLKSPNESSLSPFSLSLFPSADKEVATIETWQKGGAPNLSPSPRGRINLAVEEKYLGSFYDENRREILLVTESPKVYSDRYRYVTLQYVVRVLVDGRWRSTFVGEVFPEGSVRTDVPVENVQVSRSEAGNITLNTHYGPVQVKLKQTLGDRLRGLF